MQKKQTAIFFLEFYVIVIVLGLLSVIAIPHIGQMMSQSKAMSRENELNNIQTAVNEMLYDSAAGRLESIGPTTDMRLVHTSDTPPLVLIDYLPGMNKSAVKLDCAFGFTADGTVIPMVP